MDEHRILRSRILDQAEQRDSGYSPRSEVVTLLGQVFDGGSMPTSNDHYYLVHPVELDGAPTEGGTGTVVADTSAAVAVVVIGSKVPAPGDMLECFHVGGRWVAESRGGTPRCEICLTFLHCGDLAPIAGALVEVVDPSDDSVVDSATTDASGVACVGGLDPGTYSVRATKTGYNPYLAPSVTISGCPSTTNLTARTQLTGGSGQIVFSVGGCFGSGSVCIAPTLKIGGASVTGTGSGSSWVFRASLPAGTYTFTVTADRHDTYTGTITSLGDCSSASQSVVMSVASGFVCACSVFAYPKTLHYSDGQNGAVLTYNPGSGSWVGCGVYGGRTMVSDCTSCATTTGSAPVIISFAPSCLSGNYAVNVSAFKGARCTDYTAKAPVDCTDLSLGFSGGCDGVAGAGPDVVEALAQDGSVPQLTCGPVAASGTFTSGTHFAAFGGWSVSE